ncbi:hypothetical protein CALCODRAFT_182490 [Calocera cornea HHB12733]|uniref:Uncharacterized protein n=1 Tax=Calocera cornea HHB12733 TaxID=1353952 RepID=A0A165HSA1_9BASI|nr:hypothetical protein CALCODRAFT_182490 [Calocera cornea HHB12733]
MRLENVPIISDIGGCKRWWRAQIALILYIGAQPEPQAIRARDRANRHPPNSYNKTGTVRQPPSLLRRPSRPTLPTPPDGRSSQSINPYPSSHYRPRPD